MLVISIIYLVLITILYCLFVCLFDHNLHGRGTTSLPGFENLTVGYNKYLRPYFGGMLAPHRGAFKISLLCSVPQDFTATISLRQRWTDPRLVFHGNRSFTLDARLVELLWVPDTYIVESKRSFLHDVTVGNRLVRLFSNGTVLYALRYRPPALLLLAQNRFPELPWTGAGTSCHRAWVWGQQVSCEHSLLMHFPLFWLPEMPVKEQGSFPRLILQFELRRNVLYFILETYVPSTLLVMLSWVSFWITLDSVPARTCIGVTTVLSMTTLMIGSRSSLSKTNCFIKAIDVYLGICFSFIFGALVEYAVAHYSSSQKCAAKGPANEVTEEMEEVNITNILKNSITSYKQKISFTSIEISSDNVSCSDLTMKNHEKIKCVLRNKMHRIIGYFTIQNPGNVDHYSKLLFPLSFMVVNVFYWAYYLYF
uniref:Gamma-aminobutyric acid type A receptor pi subunit n=1 Tax=Junco hyemalis TaxID=40217 RepID=A0A8C5IE86_JUNHY